MYRTVVEAVLAHRKMQPDHLAVAFKNNTISYGELGRLMQSMAGILHEQYLIGEGDFVMISAVSKPEYVVAYLAVQYLGAISIPVDKSAKAASILDIYQYVNPKIVLMDGKIFDEDVSVISLKGLYEEALEYDENTVSISYKTPSDDSLSEILFTTGTTGKPKGGMLSIGNTYASTQNTIHGVGLEASDIELVPLPLNHSVGMRVMRSLLYLGATIVLQNGFIFAKDLEKNINTYHCTGIVTVPASLEMVYRQMQDHFSDIMGQLRFIEVGAGSLSYGMKRKLLDLLPNTRIVNTWGSTETGGAIFLDVSDNPDKLESLGCPIEGVEVNTVDISGKEVNAHDIDTAGRMVLRGPMNMLGYYKMPELTGKTLVDGWLYTNDLIYKDKDGFVYMLGRADDIINVGGEKVSPIEVENIASEFEGVRECACIGVDDPDGILGRVPVLFVVTEGNYFDEDKMICFLSERIEKYKMPHQYIQIGELPRNQMKKIDRRALAKLWNPEDNDKLMNEVVCNILSRRSVRDFTEEQISREKLEIILQCGYYAPSGHNMQTWRFTIIQDVDKIQKLREMISRVAEGNKVNFYGFNNPTTLILISNDRRNHNGIQDSSCAAENIMLAANSYGIGSVWNNALHQISDVPEIREILNSYGIPEEHIVWVAIAMGYPKEPGKLLAKKTNVVNWV